MHVSLSHARTLIEYIMVVEGMTYLIVEEFNPVLNTTNVTKIAMMHHADIHEAVAPGSRAWGMVRGQFAKQKAAQFGPPKAKAAKTETVEPPKKATKKATARKLATV